MSGPVAWVLDLDAELELADPDYVRSDRMRQVIRELSRWLLPRIRAATGDDPRLVEDGRAEIGWPPPRRGEAWCPTPRALRRLREVGVEPPEAPKAEVLRAVNHRAFGAGLGILLPGAEFVATAEECLGVLATAPDRRWLLKRPLGFSGRMRKVVVPRAFDASARTWIEASMWQYGRGLMVEPLVERIVDVSLHGRIRPDGGLEVGAPVIGDCDDDGAFRDARVALAGELRSDEIAALEGSLEVVAGALVRAGYFGPFCVDAFRWRDDDGRPHFHALSEVNARYTMAWWTGMTAGRGGLDGRRA